MRLWLAIRAFFRILFDRQVAAEIPLLLEQRAEKPALERPAVEPPKPATVSPPAKPAARPQAVRSEAVTLLATLQREARFVDIVKEPLDQYSDAQVGAAARDVLKDCGKVLERLFALRPLVEQPEGSELEAPAGYDAGRYRLVGNVQGEPPFRGRLVHPGWSATRCELPQWSGSPAAATVVAPVELEVQ